MIQNSRNISFGKRYPFQNQKEQLQIIDNLNLKGIAHRILDGVIVSGKDLVAHKNERMQAGKKSFSMDIFEHNLGQAIAQYKAAKVR